MEPLLENTKIYVRGLPEESTDDALSEYFVKYGRVVKATVAMDGLTGKPKHFGFVWFEDEDSAKAAVGDVEEHVILGTKVEVKEAIRRERSSIQDIERENCLNCERTRYFPRHSKKIFVGGLPSDLTEEEFKSFFESYGRTTDVVIIVDSESRRSRGFGFVTYESVKSARAVLRTSRYVIHGKEVEVKVAIPKEMGNTTEHPNVHSQRHPSAGANRCHHDSDSRPSYSMIRGPHYANSSPIYPYANFMVTTSPSYAYGTATPSSAYANSMVHAYNGYANTASNGYSVVALRPFTKIRISKPPGINGENSARSSSPSYAEGPSPASNLDDYPSPSVIDHGKDQASALANGHNDD